MHLSKSDIAVYAACLVVGGLAAISIRKDEKKVRQIEDELEDLTTSAAGVDAVAIHRAAEEINRRIENGEFRNPDELREAVLTEFEFQKIAIQNEKA